MEKPKKQMKQNNANFDVALSFAGEDRFYVEQVASVLRDMGFRVFYDKYEAVTLWGKDLYSHLHEIYFERARYVVVFISKHYKKKLWTNHERKSAQARAFSEKREYILPARFDNTQIPGILPTIRYINLNKYNPKDFAELIKQKIGPVERINFFPDEPDRLYKILGIKGFAKRKNVFLLARYLFKMLQLMTPQERYVLSVTTLNACPSGLRNNNVHLNLDYLSRTTGINANQLLSMFSRLDCLDIKSRQYENDEHQDQHSLVKSEQIIEVKFESSLVDYTGNTTFIMVAVFSVLAEYLCPGCAKRAIEHLDFSILSTLTGFNEVHSL